MAKSNVKYVPLRFHGNAPVEKKRIKQASGEVISIHTVDADSPIFDWQLSTVFAKNVAKARQANAGLAAAKKKTKKAKKSGRR